MYEEEIKYEGTKAVKYIEGHPTIGNVIKSDTTIIGKKCFEKCDRNIISFKSAKTHGFVRVG